MSAKPSVEQSTTQVADAVAAYISTQPWWVRRKDSLTALAALILQLANVGVLYTDEAPAWVGIFVATIIGVGQVLVHARTPGAVTPSMGPRLQAQADSMGG